MKEKVGMTVVMMVALMADKMVIHSADMWVKSMVELKAVLMAKSMAESTVGLKD